MPLDLAQCWTETPIVVVDTETTGFSNDDHICEIAAVRVLRGRVLAEYSTLIKPPIPIPESSTKIHGITDAMVAGAPSIADAAADIWRVAFDAVPCAFNAHFDRRFFHRAISGTDCELFDPSFPWLDVYVICSSPNVDKYVKGKGRLKLGACCERHGVELVGAHRALGDARATAALLWRLHEKGLVKRCSTRRMLDWGATRRKQQDEDHARFRARLARQEGSQTP